MEIKNLNQKQHLQWSRTLAFILTGQEVSTNSLLFPTDQKLSRSRKQAPSVSHMPFSESPRTLTVFPLPQKNSDTTLSSSPSLLLLSEEGDLFPASPATLPCPQRLHSLPFPSLLIVLAILHPFPLLQVSCPWLCPPVCRLHTSVSNVFKMNGLSNTKTTWSSTFSGRKITFCVLHCP